MDTAYNFRHAVLTLSCPGELLQSLIHQTESTHLRGEDMLLLLLLFTRERLSRVLGLALGSLSSQG